MTTILVVDDSGFSRGRMIAALQPLGHHVIEAADGQTGLEAAAAHVPDLIITDLLMPTLDGFGLLRALRARGLEMPVIVVGADIQSSSRQRCFELGVAGFLNKPFQPQELAQRVQEFLPIAAG